MKYANLSVGARLAAGFAVVLLLAALLALVAMLNFRQIGTVTHEMVELDWTRAEAAYTISETTRANARRTMELLVAPDAAYRARVLTHIARNKQTVSAALERIETLTSSAAGMALLTKIKTERAAYVASFDAVARLLDAGRPDEARAGMLQDTLPRLDVLLADIHTLVDGERQLVRKSSAGVFAAIGSAQVWMVLIAAAAVAAGAVLAWVLTRGIIGPLSHAVQVAQRVAAGDLTSRIGVASKDETGRLLTALDAMNRSLAGIVQEVRSGTDIIASASIQIAGGNQDLSARTEHQASALQQTASSMEELTATVQNNADQATEANQLAHLASGVAGRGGEVIAQVISTMDGIDAASRKVAEITAVIDGIAFQTNILALNAAVEAARAGEAGRGFAVVATEVRALAQRSGAAAKEIRSLVEASIAQVENGTRLVHDAGGTMREIVQNVQRVASIMADIAHASREQSAGIEQVNVAIMEMDDVTQRNAAMVEEAAAASSEMQEKAARLREMISVFRLGGAPALALPG